MRKQFEIWAEVNPRHVTMFGYSHYGVYRVVEVTNPGQHETCRIITSFNGKYGQQNAEQHRRVLAKHEQGAAND